MTGRKTATTDSPTIIGSNASLRALLGAACRVAPTRIPILITGESGTGKELVAAWVHSNSDRAPQALVTINCAAFPDNLLEDELFGHRRGSFTGATQDRPGLLERADGSTVFLDEVAEMSPACQAKLLRFLESGAIRPLGSDDERVLDVRIVAATHRDLRAMIQAGSFREDLYYRLAGDELHVPPLRARPEDIPDLVKHFLADSHRLMSRTGLELSPEAMNVLKSCRWPGNVRQLRNVVHRAAVHGGAAAMTADELLAFLPAEDLPPREEWGVQRQLGRDFTTAILEYLRENGKTSAIELKRALNLRRTTFFRNVKPLLTHGLVEATGMGRATHYEALEVTPPVVNAAPEPVPATSPLTTAADQIRWQTLLGIIEKEGRITRSRFMEATGLPTRTASRFLIRLVDEGLLKDDGQKGRAKGYTRA